jgi:hypothetical protein
MFSEVFDLLLDLVSYVSGRGVVFGELLLELETCHVPSINVLFHRLVILIEQGLVSPLLKHGANLECYFQQLIERLEILVKLV